MLTQGPAPDPKCKSNISSFLTLPHLLGCLIFTWNSVSIVLLFWMIGEWDRWGVVDSYQGVWGWTGNKYYLKVFFPCAFVFCSLMLSVPFFKWLEHDSCCVCFCASYLFSLSPVPLTKSYWGMEVFVSVMKNYLWSQAFRC